MQQQNIDAIGNTIHHAVDDKEIKKVTLIHVVVRQLLWPMFMDFPRQNDSGPQPYPIEEIGMFTLMVMAWWVVVLAAAPVANVPLKPPTLSLYALEYHLSWAIDSYLVST